MQRKWSDESKRKHSERMKNVWASNKKMGMSGKQQSVETRVKIGNANAIALTGRVASLSTRKKMSVSAKASENSGRWVKGQQAYNNGVPVAESVKKKISLTVSRKLKEAYANGTRKYATSDKRYNTQIEQLVAGFLTELGLSYVQQKHVVGVGYVDFYLQEYNMIIEADGCYWHGCQLHYPTANLAKQQRDVRKHQTLTASGYLFLRLWEHDIRTNKHKCIQLINNLIEF